MCARKLLFFKASAPQSGSRKLLPKVAAESCSPTLLLKLLPKGAPHSKLLFKAAVQSCSSKLLRLPKPAPQTCSTKLFPKAVPQTCYPKLLRATAKPPKVVSESGFPKLLSKAHPQSCRSSKQLFVNAAAKPQSCSPQLLPKAALQSCYRKPRPNEVHQNSKACPKLPQSWSGKLPKAAPQSCSPALLPKVVPQSCSPKLLPHMPNATEYNYIHFTVTTLALTVAFKSRGSKVQSLRFIV